MPSTLTSTEPRPVAPADVEQIPYERSVPWYAQRRSFYIIVFMMLLNAVATTSVTWGPPTLAGLREWRAARRAKEQQAQAAAAQQAAKLAALQAQQALQQKLLQFTLPPGHLVYTEDPAEAERLLPSGQGYSTIRGQTGYGASFAHIPHLPVLWDAPELRKLLDQAGPPTSERGGTVFLHERKSPAGRSRLVWVRVSASQSANQNGGALLIRMSRTLHTEVAEPANASGAGGWLWSHKLGILQPAAKHLVLAPLRERTDPRAASEISTPVQRGEVLRILAGRPDPRDPAHFTIDYVLDGQPGVIDGWLQNDDRVRLEPRQGTKRLSRMDSKGGEEHWDPYGIAPKPPATAPTLPPRSQG